MPTATIVQQEPMIRTPHKGDGYTVWTLDEAKELHESLGAAIRQVEHAALRMAVTYGDDVLEQALRHLIEWQESRSMVHRGSTTVAVAIDCLRAVLGVEA